MQNDDRQTPETYFISLAAQGVKFPLEVNEDVINNIVSDIRLHKPRIYFPFYWKNVDVKRLDSVLLKIKPDDLKKTLFNIKILVGERYPYKLHWMESINIFHLMGIFRKLSKVDDTLSNEIEKFIREEFRADFKKISQYTIIDISSLIAVSVAKKTELKDAMGLVNVFMTNPELFKYYGYYQMHYYGGINSTINKMKEYIGVDDPCQIVIPQTLIGLASIHIDRYPWYGNINILHDLFDQLPQTLKNNTSSIFYDFLKNGR